MISLFQSSGICWLMPNHETAMPGLKNTTKKISKAKRMCVAI